MRKNKIEDNKKSVKDYHIYSVIFPYQVRFTLEGDGNNTEVIINSKSEETFYGKSEEDISLQKELADAYSKNTYSRYIKNWVMKEMDKVKPQDCRLRYTGEPTIRPMTDEELEIWERQVLSSNE